MSEFDKENYKDRLQAKVERNRKQREKRFLRYAVPILIFSFAAFLLLTEPGRTILSNLGWLGSDESLSLWPIYLYLGIMAVVSWVI
ncbi:MAG: hypothetical protein AAF926_06895, partial [Pseudomonadota bacterium]